MAMFNILKKKNNEKWEVILLSPINSENDQILETVKRALEDQGIKTQLTSTELPPNLIP